MPFGQRVGREAFFSISLLNGEMVGNGDKWWNMVKNEAFAQMKHIPAFLH